MADVPLYHYMEDVLVVVEKQEGMEKALTFVITSVTLVGLCVAPEKIQRQPPWKYLARCIKIQTIIPQPLQIKTNICTLQHVKNFRGTINWVRPLLGIPNTDLSPLFALLKGKPVLLLPKQLTSEACQSLQQVGDAISN